MYVLLLYPKQASYFYHSCHKLQTMCYNFHSASFCVSANRRTVLYLNTVSYYIMLMLYSVCMVLDYGYPFLTLAIFLINLEPVEQGVVPCLFRLSCDRSSIH